MARNKLGLTEGATLALIAAPTDLVLEIPTGVTIVEKGAARVVIVFVGQRGGIEPAVKSVRGRVEDDGMMWFAYPKAGQLGTDLDRDHLSAALSALELEPVSLVSVDDVWSAMRVKVDAALRTRRQERGFAMTTATAKAGRVKAAETAAKSSRLAQVATAARAGAEKAASAAAAEEDAVPKAKATKPKAKGARPKPPRPTRAR